MLLIFTAYSYADEDIYVAGGANRAEPTELEAGVVYNAKGNACSFTSWPGERNGDWYVINTLGYNRIVFHFPIVTSSDQHWIEIFDEDGEYIESTAAAKQNDEFSYVSEIGGNDRIYFQVIFNSWSGDNQARFSICLENSLDVDVWEEHSTHIWENVRSDKSILNEATCTAEGIMAHKKCALCGMLGYYERIPTTPHKPGEWMTESEATCEEPGKQIIICSECGEAVEERAIPAKGHTFTDWSVIVQATYRTPGSHERFCEVCSKVEQEEYSLNPPKDLLESGDYELVILPNETAQLIGYYGFDSEVVLPEDYEGHTLASISSEAFANVVALSKLTIPSSVIEIEDGAFDDFPNIELTVTRDSYAAQFAKDNGINSHIRMRTIGLVNKGEDLKMLRRWYFVYLLILVMMFPHVRAEGSDELPDRLFESDGFHYTIKTDDTAEIYSWSNYDGGLYDLYIPETLDGHKVTSISSQGHFYGNETYTITIPDCLTEIPANPFVELFELTRIDVSPDHPSFSQWIKSCFLDVD